MKTKLIITLTLSFLLFGIVSFAQEGAVKNDQKWRMIYNEKKEPIAIGLSSNNSYTVNGKAVRAEVIFFFHHGSGLMDFNGPRSICIRTGDMQLIGSKTIEVSSYIKNDEGRGAYTLVTGKIFHYVVWDEESKMYKVDRVDWRFTANQNGWRPGEQKDLGGKLNHFFGVDDDEDETGIINNVRAFTLEYPSVDKREMKFYIFFHSSLLDDTKGVVFSFERTEVPEQYSKELWALARTQFSPVPRE